MAHNYQPQHRPRSRRRAWAVSQRRAALRTPIEHQSLTHANDFSERVLAVYAKRVGHDWIKRYRVLRAKFGASRAWGLWRRERRRAAGY